MNTLRKHGEPPYIAAVLHGGPGAPGSAFTLARDVAKWCGALEPMQTAHSVDGQVEELVQVLKAHARIPAVLVGWSWGAMLGYITAARYPELVSKLIMVGSGVFEDHYAEEIMPLRLGRLTPAERIEARHLMLSLADPACEEKDEVMARFGRLMSKADTYWPIETSLEAGHCSFEVHVKAWADLQDMRASGYLLEMGRDIRCPVVAIHGDHDSHPAEGVRTPLASVLHDFRFILLDNCGHSPWNEKMARQEFLDRMQAELETDI